MSLTLHAHVAYSGADCDGRTDSSYVVPLDTDEIHEHALVVHAAVERGEPDGPYWNDFFEIHFKERVVAQLANPYAIVEGYEQTITIRRAGFTAHEVTEEGYTRYDVEWCESRSCDPNVRTYRDRRAEAAGY